MMTIARRAQLLLLSLLCCSCLAFGPPALTDSDVPTRRLSPEQLRAMRHVSTPQITAASAMLVNTTTGSIIYSLNEHERRAPASLTKIVTAIVALQHVDLDTAYTVLPIDLSPTTVAGLRDGENLTVRQLLFFLLVPSDNAAAMVLARNIGAAQGVFVGWMNDLVAQWGLQDTHFVNPHGLDHDDHYSSAYDMAIIARNAMLNPVFAEIVSYPEAVVAKHWIVSTNELLNSYPGVIGVKTGTTDEAGQCLIAMAQRHQGTVLAVVMGSSDRFADARALLDYFYANYAELHVDLPSSDQNRYQDAEGNWHEFGVHDAQVYLVAPWQLQSVAFYRRIDDPATNPGPDEPIGALQVTLAGQPLVEVPLYAR